MESKHDLSEFYEGAKEGKLLEIEFEGQKKAEEGGRTLKLRREASQGVLTYSVLHVSSRFVKISSCGYKEYFTTRGPESHEDSDIKAETLARVVTRKSSFVEHIEQC